MTVLKEIMFTSLLLAGVTLSKGLFISARSTGLARFPRSRLATLSFVNFRCFHMGSRAGNRTLQPGHRDLNIFNRVWPHTVSHVFNMATCEVQISSIRRDFPGNPRRISQLIDFWLESWTETKMEYRSLDFDVDKQIQYSRAASGDGKNLCVYGDDDVEC